MISNSVEIGNICDLQEGYVNPSQKVPGYFGGGIRWLRAVDLNDAEVFETSRTLSQAGYESAGKSALMFPANSIGISKSGTIGRLGILRKPMCGNRAVINIVPKQSNDFLFASDGATIDYCNGCRKRAKESLCTCARISNYPMARAACARHDCGYSWLYR